LTTFKVIIKHVWLTFS